MTQYHGKQPPFEENKATVLTPDRGGYMAGKGHDWSDVKTRNYYNIPLVSKTHWSWEIITYFFLGGISGCSFLIATIAHFIGFEKDQWLIRTGRYLSFVTLLLSPLLLIKDLGRPERFLHMLRIIKLRSVMSIGTWALSFFGVCCGLVSVHQAAKDGVFYWFPLASRILKALPILLLEIVGSFFGVIVASYTGVLLAATATPLWARARYLLGPLFFTSALSTALSSISLLLSLRHRRNASSLRRLEHAEIVALSTELGLITALVPTLGKLGKPLLSGRDGILFWGGTVIASLLTPLTLRLGSKTIGKEMTTPINALLSLLTLIGGLILRYVWIDAGRKSANDPDATHLYNASEWQQHHSLNSSM